MGILVDTGAAHKSTAGLNQFEALQKQQPSIKIDKSRAGEVKVKFGVGGAISIGATTIQTPIGAIEFHVVPTATPFLLSLQDLDDRSIYYNNVDNMLVAGDKRYPIVRAFGHPWMMLEPHKALSYLAQNPENNELQECHLTTSELLQLHRRFGHPAWQRFQTILSRAGH